MTLYCSYIKCTYFLIGSSSKLNVLMSYKSREKNPLSLFLNLFIEIETSKIKIYAKGGDYNNRTLHLQNSQPKSSFRLASPTIPSMILLKQMAYEHMCGNMNCQKYKQLCVHHRRCNQTNSICNIQHHLYVIVPNNFVQHKTVLMQHNTQELQIINYN